MFHDTFESALTLIKEDPSQSFSVSLLKCKPSISFQESLQSLSPPGRFVSRFGFV